MNVSEAFAAIKKGHFARLSNGQGYGSYYFYLSTPFSKEGFIVQGYIKVPETRPMMSQFTELTVLDEFCPNIFDLDFEILTREQMLLECIAKFEEGEAVKSKARLS